MQFLFPHEKIRPVQDKFMNDFWKCLENKRSMVAHAPTGLGKTAAALGPALTYAEEKDYKIFFLTSRHTQHAIVLSTIEGIQQRHNKKFLATSIIGKKWMCAQSGIEILPSSEFSEYCKHLKEHGHCEFYSSLRGKDNEPSNQAKYVLGKLGERPTVTAEDLLALGREQKLCPYELGLLRAQNSRVIVSDYFYMFNPTVRERFFAKIHAELEKSIIIADEAHNLPGRLRELYSHHLSTQTCAQAFREAKQANLSEAAQIAMEIEEAVSSLGTATEKVITKEEFMDKITAIGTTEDIVEQCYTAGEIIIDSRKRSAFFGIGGFIQQWEESDEGYAKIVRKGINKKGPFVSVHNICLDPGDGSREVFAKAYSSLLMSGTLTPTDMYPDILGMPDNTFTKEYESPFDATNRLALVMPQVTTRYTQRNEEQYLKIAQHCAEIANAVPGNTAIFFPSYSLRDTVHKIFEGLCKKTVFLEQAGLTKEEKTGMLNAFAGYQKTGAVLLGVATGSFGEGIDLPGDLLKCVVIVGLPLTKPDLEIQSLIAYYQEKFGRGWDYGYVLPAITKTLQNAGRCIRSETDRGVIAFLDERYSWPQYTRCFPNDWNLNITLDCIEKIKTFFGGEAKKTANPSVFTGFRSADKIL